MRTTVLLAVPEPWETTLVGSIAASSCLELARRCADLPELLSTAAAGLGEAAVISAGLAGLDRTAVADLARDGVRVVGVTRPGEETQERILRGMGVEVILPADAATERLQAVLSGHDDPEIQAWLASLGEPGQAAVDQGPRRTSAPVVASDADDDARTGQDFDSDHAAGLAPGRSAAGGPAGLPLALVGGPPAGPVDGSAAGLRDAPEPESDVIVFHASVAGAAGAAAEAESAHPAGIGHALASSEPGGWRPRDAGDADRARRDRRKTRKPARNPARAAESPPRPGRVVAVWGPAGAPGRSSVALGIASEVAGAGATALLVDADPYGGVQAQSLAILDETPGLAGAVRRADQGDLDLAGLTERCLHVAPGLEVLTGVSRADRWPELRPDPLARVLTLARQLADLVVVDCGFSLEDDEELSYDTAAPRRNAATLAALACADHLVVVGGAEPVGLLRLVRGLADLDTIRTPHRRTVVVNRLRESAVGRRPQATVAAALEQFAGLTGVRFIPDDRLAFDRAALQGRTLAECAPQSPARAALVEIAIDLLDRPLPDPTRPSRRAYRLRPRANAAAR